MKTTMKKDKTVSSKKISEDYYFILQLYILTKNVEQKRAPTLPVDDTKNLLAQLNTRKQNSGLINAFRQHVYSITNPVFRRTVA